MSSGDFPQLGGVGRYMLSLSTPVRERGILESGRIFGGAFEVRSGMLLSAGKSGGSSGRGAGRGWVWFLC